MNARRLEAVRKKLKALRLDALLVTFIPHIRYLANFSGSNALLYVSSRQQWFFSDGRYRNQARNEVRDYQRIITGETLFQALRKKLPRKRLRVGFDPAHVSVLEFQNLKRLFPEVKFVPAGSVVATVASVKDESEIDLIRKAASISENVFAELLGAIRDGISELDLAAEIAYLHRRFGAEADAFEPIVASGVRGALPHARATSKKLRKGELITIDFGCRYQGYHSDLTRTVALGRIGKNQQRIYTVVRDAQRFALDAARDGLRGSDLDAVARKHIDKHRMGKYFMHSLGHGLGLQVHESPRISALSAERLQAGHVITVEPGVYIEGTGGVRIEDDIVIRKGGRELITTLPTDLISL